MIEVELGSGHDPYLIVDGVMRETGVDIQKAPGGKRFDVAVLDNDLITELTRHRVSDISEEVQRIVLHTSYRLLRGVQEIFQGLEVYRGKDDQTYIALIFNFIPEDWKRLWNIKEYQIEFQRAVERARLPGVLWTPGEARYFPVLSPLAVIALSFKVGSRNTTIEAEVSKHSDALNRLHEAAEASLLAKLRRESVVMHFDFPEAVKVSCEQYLIYFVQFLKDLGVKATAELRHDAGGVLFAVTPVNKDEALDKIHAALRIYLSLAASPVGGAAALDSEVAIQRLVGEIHGLQSRLSLARAEMQFKDAAIRAQQFVIDQQHLLGGEVMVESIRGATPRSKEEDKEELFGGIIALGTLNWNGVEISFAEIFRRLRQVFRKSD